MRFLTTSLFLSLSFCVAAEVAAQSAQRTSVHIRIGWLSPGSSVPMERREGQIRLSSSPTLGLAVERAMNRRAALRGGIDVAVARGEPRITGPVCEQFAGGIYLDADCRYRGGSRDPLLHGRIEMLGRVSAMHGILGTGVRWFHRPTEICATDSPTCGTDQDPALWTGLTATLVGGIGINRTVSGRTIGLEITDTIGQYRGRTGHELLMTLAIGL